MTHYRIRARYATHPNSNVGAIVATAAGRRMRVRVDQALNFEDQAEQVAAELATRQGWHLTGQRDALEGGGYVFTAAPGAAPAVAGHTIRELCTGDILAVDTFESGQLVGIVRSIDIRATSGTVVLELADGRRRSIISGADDAGFRYADPAAARAFRASAVAEDVR